MSSYSFSQLQSYARCPYQYKLAYIAKVPRQGSAPMSFGISMHTTLQAFYNKVKELNTEAQASLFGTATSSNQVQSNIIVPTKEYLLHLFQEKFVEAWYETQEDIAKMRKHGAELLDAYYDMRMGHWPMPLATEAGFSLQIERIVVKGKIDRIDIGENGLEIVDYKSGKKPAILSEADKQQLYIYQLATTTLPSFKHYGETTLLKYVYLSTKDEYAFIGNEEQLAETKDAIISINTQIQARDFTATPSETHCKGCAYRASCEFSAYAVDQEIKV